MSELDPHQVYRQEDLLLLENTPGIDPVLATLEGHRELLPDSGWLVNCWTIPGQSGVIDVYHYDKLEVDERFVHDKREYEGSSDMYVTLRNFGHFVLAYEQSSTTAPQESSPDRKSMAIPSELSTSSGQVTVMSDGSGSIYSQVEPFSPDLGNEDNAIDVKVITEDYSQLSNILPNEPQEVAIARLAKDPKELLAILGHLTMAVGMTADGIKASTSILKQKMLNT